MFHDKLILIFQGRVVKPPPTEKSYHIFYQMMAGLHQEERIQLGLDGLTVRDLNYLNIGDIRQDETEDAKRFEEWRASLAILGIPFMDVVRVLSAILLLGNVVFAPGLGEDAFDVEIIGKSYTYYNFTGRGTGIVPLDSLLRS